MLLLIGWRNIWRNKLRSIVVILAVGLGVWALLFLLGFTRGIVRDYITQNIELRTSFFQMHHPEFKKDYDVSFVIPNEGQIEDYLSKDERIKTYALRTVSNGMLSNAKGARGMKIFGIDPEKESSTSLLDQRIAEGDYFDDQRRNQILVGDDLAEKLHLKLRKKIVLSFQDKEGNIVSAAFRIKGIFDTKNTPVDLSQVYILRKDMNRILNLDENDFHEVAVVGYSIDNVDQLVQAYVTEFDGLSVASYKELSPELELFNAQLRINLLVMTCIFMLALIFGIINTMLMAVLERMKEIGMLLSIGMNKTRVFLMILIETILLSMIGTPLGLILGVLSINYFKKYGLDLSNFSGAMQSYGMNEIVRPYLTWEVYLFVLLSVFITAILAALYPARKATKLNPVEAIRTL